LNLALLEYNELKFKDGEPDVPVVVVVGLAGKNAPLADVAGLVERLRLLYCSPLLSKVLPVKGEFIRVDPNSKFDGM
jgi:hypothetical protein